jgi:hypothetical protein
MNQQICCAVGAKAIDWSGSGQHCADPTKVQAVIPDLDKAIRLAGVRPVSPRQVRRPVELSSKRLLLTGPYRKSVRLLRGKLPPKSVVMPSPVGEKGRLAGVVGQIAIAAVTPRLAGCVVMEEPND